KEIRGVSRHGVAAAATVFPPLCTFLIPAFLFGAASAVNGRAAGLAATVGTDDLPGFICFGGLIGGLIGMAFWGVAFSIRMEMDTGTLEATWLTPTHHETVVIGRALGSLFWFAISQVALFAFGIWVLGLRLRLEMLLALPAVLCAILAMVVIAYLLAGIVLIIRVANFFVFMWS